MNLRLHYPSFGQTGRIFTLGLTLAFLSLDVPLVLSVSCISICFQHVLDKNDPSSSGTENPIQEGCPHMNSYLQPENISVLVHSRVKMLGQVIRQCPRRTVCQGHMLKSQN
jgi:hypothetical protein